MIIRKIFIKNNLNREHNTLQNLKSKIVKLNLNNKTKLKLINSKFNQSISKKFKYKLIDLKLQILSKGPPYDRIIKSNILCSIYKSNIFVIEV